jgi:hypothetical protein
MSLMQYEVVRVISIRDDRFSQAQVFYQRLPTIGDVGTVLEVYTDPEIGYEVECSDPSTGATVWLEPMYPEELEPA